MLKKIFFFYGPKYNFRRSLTMNKPLTKISELAIYSDKKMRDIPLRCRANAATTKRNRIQSSLTP